jgi:hypothetical protein
MFTNLSFCAGLKLSAAVSVATVLGVLGVVGVFVCGG